MTINGHDPLTQTADAAREAFTRMSAAANGFTAEDVAGAAANMLVNAIRQAHPLRREAIAALDEISARTKELLAQHYDVTGKRRNVFPFHQVVEMPYLDARPKRQFGGKN